jgi:hypothetical protein
MFDPIMALIAPTETPCASGAPRSASMLFLLFQIVATLCLGFTLLIVAWLVLAPG